MKTSKKPIHFTTDISIFMGHKHFEVYEVLFCTYCIGLVFKKQSLCLYSPYIHKTLLTLGNEKEQ